MAAFLVMFQLDAKNSYEKCVRKTLMKLTPCFFFYVPCRITAKCTGVNFINVLRAAFEHSDPKIAKKTDNLTVFLALLVSV